MTETPTLGMKWDRTTPSSDDAVASGSVVNTRTSLWPSRWPAIALQECIDTVEAAPVDLQSEVKWNLPCKVCVKNTECLNAKRKELGPLMYDREILTKPRSSESSLFPMSLFQPLMNRQANCVPYWRKPFSLEHEYAIVQAWDIAWSEKIGGDYLVCMTGYVHRLSGRRVLLDVQRWQRLGFTEQCELIEARWQAFKADAVVIEGDAAQAVWRQHMSKTTAVPVLSHASGSKGDLAAGVPGLLIMLENRKWEFPYAQGYHRDEVDVFLAEAEAFGWVDGKLQGVGEHDDTVMCWWHLNWGMDKFVDGNAGGDERRIGNQQTAEI